MQKQTFSAKALGNEYATGVSRPAVFTTKELTRGNIMNRNQARRLAAFNAKKAAEKHFTNRIGEILSGCPSRVDRATSLGSLRDSNTGGSACLPDVGLYAAGYRNSKDSVTAR